MGGKHVPGVSAHRRVDDDRMASHKLLAPLLMLLHFRTDFRTLVDLLSRSLLASAKGHTGTCGAPALQLPSKATSRPRTCREAAAAAEHAVHGPLCVRVQVHVPRPCFVASPSRCATARRRRSGRVVCAPHCQHQASQTGTGGHTLQRATARAAAGARFASPPCTFIVTRVNREGSRLPRPRFGGCEQCLNASFPRAASAKHQPLIDH
eukprot:scaffold2752_cov393-Prasinococcus_capsulatus_cf.AAC.44